MGRYRESGVILCVDYMNMIDNDKIEFYNG